MIALFFVQLLGVLLAGFSLVHLKVITELSPRRVQQMVSIVILVAIASVVAFFFHESIFPPRLEVHHRTRSRNGSLADAEVGATDLRLVRRDVTRILHLLHGRLGLEYLRASAPRDRTGVVNA
ncbi:MAG: hypothetical protein HYR85_08385 [Planctomycetes bacterium]|nr:hypothetical protein [Planctomycetota bacterium]MBI3845310.1 hypothetical protein [Planctomycetota bacterium]